MDNQNPIKVFKKSIVSWVGKKIRKKFTLRKMLKVMVFCKEKELVAIENERLQHLKTEKDKRLRHLRSEWFRLQEEQAAHMKTERERWIKRYGNEYYHSDEIEDPRIEKEMNEIVRELWGTKYQITPWC